MDTTADPTGPRSLTRILGLFDVLSHTSDGMSLAELSLVLESPKSSLLNLLRPLVAEGYLLHANQTYRLGPSIFRLAAGVMAAWNFPQLIRPFMVNLALLTGETTMLGVLVPEAEVITYVEIIDSPQPIRYQVPPGTSRPLYASSAGRLLVAYAEPKWSNHYLASVVLKDNMAIPFTRAGLVREIKNIRAAGISCSFDSYATGLASVAAPVFDSSGRCVASLNVAGPSSRFKNELEFLQSTVRDVATRASGIAGVVTRP